MRSMAFFLVVISFFLASGTVVATPPKGVESFARKQFSDNPNLKPVESMPAAAKKSHQAAMAHVEKVRPAANEIIKLLPGYKKYVAVMKARQVTGIVVLNGVK